MRAARGRVGRAVVVRMARDAAAMSSLLASLVAARHISEGDALFWIGVLVVVACLITALVALFRLPPPTNYAVAAGAVVVAIVAALLLL